MRILNSGAVIAMVTLIIGSPAVAQDTDTVDLMFVQSIAGGGYGDGVLVLDGVHHSIFFSESPGRVVGVMTIDEFAEYMDTYMTGYRPNAALVITGTDDEYVIELDGPPVMEGDRLSYTIEMLEGELPCCFDGAVLFIDALPTPVNGMITDAATAAPTEVNPMITD